MSELVRVGNIFCQFGNGQSRVTYIGRFFVLFFVKILRAFLRAARLVTRLVLEDAGPSLLAVYVQFSSSLVSDWHPAALFKYPPNV